MSYVVDISGNSIAERHAKVDACEQGLSLRMSTSHVAAYVRNENMGRSEDYDVIMVNGPLHSYEYTQAEKESKERIIFGDQYLASDFRVVLEKPDTAIYHFSQSIPRYIAEGSMIRGLQALMTSGATLGISLVGSLLLGFGWWSPLIALVCASAVLLYFVRLSDELHLWIASIRTARFVRSRIRSGAGTREHYMRILKHLTLSESRHFAQMCRYTLKFL